MGSPARSEASQAVLENDRMNFAIADLRVRIFAFACLLGLYSLRSLAGELPVLWDAVPQSDIAGYRVYYNTKPVEHGATEFDRLIGKDGQLAVTQPVEQIGRAHV